MAALEILPDVCFLEVIKYLNVTDCCNLMHANERAKTLCCEKSIARTIDLESSYLLGEDSITQYIGAAAHHVEKLRLNHCQWLTSKCVQFIMHKCTNITHLDVIECKVKTNALVQRLARMPNLVSLSFSIVSFSDIKKDIFSDAEKTLDNLSHLHIYFTSHNLSIMTYLGEHSTMLDYCTNLEQLCIGSAGMAIPELYRPVISEPSRFKKLKDMCITNNIHAGAQMLFYGTLQQLPNSQLQWSTLLMPNVNLAEFTKKKEFSHCLKNIEHLKSLDISGSKANFPNPAVELSKAEQLEHLSLAATKVGGRDLADIVQCCPHLTTLNLNSCPNILQQSTEYEQTGLVYLLKNCRHLRHLNLSGEHYHTSEESTLVTSAITGLKSLSLSTCMLTDESYTDRKPGRRIASARGHGMAPPKNRISLVYSSGESISLAKKRTCLDSSGHDMAPPKKRICLDSSGGYSACPSTSAAAAAAAPPSRTVMENIVTNNPELECLEIINPDYNSVINKNKFVTSKQHKFTPCLESRKIRDSAILPICRLECLRSLTLCGLPGLTSGTSIATILQSCRRLQSLSLSMLGGGLFGNLFTKALPQCEYLEDLRLEQPYLPLNAVLFDALSQCPRLQRLCILAKESCFSRDSVLNMVEQCRYLVVLRIYAGGTITASKNLMTTLRNKYYRSSRPGASFIICPMMADSFSDVEMDSPAKHQDELTRFYSRVATHPPKHRRS